MKKSNLRLAKRLFGEGNLAAAEIACRNIIDEDPKNPAAQDILKKIAEKLGICRNSVSPLSAALKAASKHEFIEDIVRGQRESPYTVINDATPGMGYLLIKSWGAGFWSEVSNVLGCLLLAEITNRIPVVHWGKNCLYGERSSRDAFRYYFEPPSDITIDDLIKIEKADFFPIKWDISNLYDENIEKWEGEFSRLSVIYFLARPEKIVVCDFYIGVISVLPWLPASHPMHEMPCENVYRYLIGKYLRPQGAIIRACDDMRSRLLKGNSYIAVHLRGSDKITEDNNLEDSNQACLATVSKFDASLPIFLLTDDDKLLFKANELYRDRVVYTSSVRTNNRIGVHIELGRDGLQLGAEIMLDTYIAVGADIFIGNGRTNVSAMISMLKDWKSSECILVHPPSLLTDRIISMHMRSRPKSWLRKTGLIINEVVNKRSWRL